MPDISLTRGRGKAFRPAVRSSLFLFGLFAIVGVSFGQSTPNSDVVELDPFGGASFFGTVTQTGFNEKLVNGGIAGGRAAYNFSRHFSLVKSKLQLLGQ